jgi:hypothetical protein
MVWHRKILEISATQGSRTRLAIVTYPGVQHSTTTHGIEPVGVSHSVSLLSKGRRAYDSFIKTLKRFDCGESSYGRHFQAALPPGRKCGNQTMIPFD